MKRHIKLGIAGVFCWMLAYTIDLDNNFGLWAIFALAGLILIIPTVWIYGWRLIGVAVRVARSEVEKH